MHKLLLLLFILAIAVAGTIYFVVASSPEHQAEEAAEEFYAYEQRGAFSKSWEMLHPMMKEKFPKGTYIQDRSDVIMNYFGVLHFTYSFGDIEEMKNWLPTVEGEPIPTVYRITVSQHFNGKYGNSTLIQDVYMAEVDGEWKLLWDYQNMDS
ncbi:hypothetical protein [Virgibacillus sp. Bac332]|uniref:hypothetical protein n=1 Tax=Virgibacillus sp. Bac332 TaxID=2419842 RepID=UPI000EF51DD2|nr:hypothetical protein [Virgibacillus sp. Bac332]